MQAPLSAQSIAAAFRGKIPPVRVSPFYRLGLALVSVAMVLLPLAYVALIGLVGYGVFYHLTEHTTLLSGRGGGLWRLLAYLGPAVIGATAILFMVKPLLARPAKGPPRLSLEPGAERLLFALVAGTCAALGAPMPRRIDVDCEVNASASFRRGFLSFLANDLVLTIGLPLAAGFSLRELLGVLAHEFGHFAQGTGMRLSYVIRSVNAWFARVVYERDAWDERLRYYSENSDGRIAIVLMLARGLVWLSRKILWVFMLCGHAISSFLLRQMEYDADLHGSRLVGAPPYASALRKLPLLVASSNKAYADLRDSWNERRLGNELPALLVEALRRMPSDVRTEIEQCSAQERTGLFDTHPSQTDRLRLVEKDAAPGVFHLDLPAAEAFRDFSAVSKAATRMLYEQLLGQEFSVETLIPTEALLERQRRVEASREAYGRYFGELWDEEEPLRPPEDASAPAELPAALKELEALRSEIGEAAERVPALRQSLEEQRGRVRQAHVLKAFHEAGIKVTTKSVELKSSAPGAIDALREEVESAAESARAKLSPLGRSIQRRFALATSLLRAEEARPIIERAGSSAAELERLLSVLGALAAAHPALLELGRIGVIQEALGELVSDASDDQKAKLYAVIERNAREWRRQLAALQAALEGTDYPFEHALGKVSIADYAIDPLPEEAAGAFAMYPVALGARDRLWELSYRVRGRLAELAERAERELAPSPTSPGPGG